MSFGNLWQLWATFVIFLHFLASFGIFWQLLATLDIFWRHLATFTNFCYLSAPCHNLCNLLPTFGNFFQFLATFAMFWQFPHFLAYLSTFVKFWQTLAHFGILWQLCCCAPKLFCPLLEKKFGWTTDGVDKSGLSGCSNIGFAKVFNNLGPMGGWVIKVLRARMNFSTSSSPALATAGNLRITNIQPSCENRSNPSSK